MNQERECRELFVKYLRSLTKLSARWVSFTHTGNNGDSADVDRGACFDCLSELMGLEYNSMYLPFMQRCGLFHLKKSNRWGKGRVAPSITAERGVLYIWEDFLLEYQLQPSVTQISHYFRSGKKEYFLLVGTFDEAPFTVREQISNPRRLGASSRGLRGVQRSFAESLAHVMPWLIQPPSLPSNESMEEHPHEELESSQQESLPLPDNNINDENDLMDNKINDENDSVSNLKHLLQVQLFGQILKPGGDITII